MSLQTSMERRKVKMSQTMESFKRDLAGAEARPPRVPLEKILTFVGKPVTLSPFELRLDENIRREIDQDGDEYGKLRESIRVHGILQSILVEVREADGDYELVCVEGHRRAFVAQELGLERVPCILAKYVDRAGRTSAALAASIKEDLHPLDRAEAFAELEAHGVPVKDICAQYERDERTVRRYLKMAKWSLQIKAKIRANKEHFTTRFLFQKMAQTDLSDEELERIVEKHLEVSDSKQTARSKRSLLPQEMAAVSIVERFLGKDAVSTLIRNGNVVLSIDFSDPSVVEKIIGLETPLCHRNLRHFAHRV